MTTEKCTPENRYEIVSALYEKAHTKQLIAKSESNMIDFWRYTSICLRLLKSKANCLHN